MEIIPAIDIIDGKCVRLTRGDYRQKKEYNTDPLEVAREFEDHGIKRLHLVDLDGARKKEIVNLKVLERISHYSNLKIDFGGGIQSEGDLKKAFSAGAQQVTAGSLAVKNPLMVINWLQHYGPKKIILGADVIDRKIAVSGWTEKTKLDVFELILEYRKHNLKYAICTDVDKDGVMQGPSLTLYQDILAKFPDLNLIASGGITTIEDLKSLKKMGCSGAIIGKAIYEKKISLKQLEEFL